MSDSATAVGRWAFGLLVACNIALLVGAGWYVATRGVTAEKGWTPESLVTIVLAALAVLLAVVTIFLAAFAFWGYNALRRGSETMSAQVAERVAREVAQTRVPREVNTAVQLWFSLAGLDPATVGVDLADALRRKSQEAVDDGS